MKRSLPSKHIPKLLLDENIGFRVYGILLDKGYDVKTILKEKRGAPDEEIIKIAAEQNRIIITLDKDFGYLAQAYKPPGIVLLRLRNPIVENRVKAIIRAIKLGGQLYGYITVVEDYRIRKRPI